MEAMELKVKQTRTISDVKRQTGRLRILGFIQNFKDELKRVSWTTKAELLFCTKIVVGATFVFGMAIYLSDLAIKTTLDSISFLMHAIFG